MKKFLAIVALVSSTAFGAEFNCKGIVDTGPSSADIIRVNVAITGPAFATLTRTFRGKMYKTSMLILKQKGMISAQGGENPNERYLVELRMKKDVFGDYEGEYYEYDKARRDARNDRPSLIARFFTCKLR